MQINHRFRPEQEFNSQKYNLTLFFPHANTFYLIILSPHAVPRQTFMACPQDLETSQAIKV